MPIKRLIVVTILIFTLIVFNSLSITPEIVEKSTVKVVQKVYYSVSGAKSVEIKLYIPQNDEYQKILSVSVSGASFEKSKDEYGNTFLVLKPSKSRGEIKVTTILEVKRRTPVYIQNRPEMQNIEAVPLPESLFERVNLTKNKMEKVLLVAEWVNENVRYDENYSNVTLSPLEVLEKKAGVCDEFSVLTLAFLKTLNITARYQAGYAFDGKRFMPHAWVRIYANNLLWEMDPTWCEAPVDALHITFASLPNASFSEISASAKGIAPRINLLDEKIDIELLNIEKEKKNKLNINAKLLENTSYPGAYDGIEINAFSKTCVLTQLSVGECIDYNGNRIVYPVFAKKCFAICTRARSFGVLKISEGSPENVMCNITVSTSFGAEGYDVLRIKKQAEIKPMRIKLIKYGENLYKAYSNAHVFTLSGEYVFGNGMLRVFPGEKVFVLLSGRLKTLTPEKEKAISIIEKEPVKKKPSEQKEKDKEEKEQKEGIIKSIISFFKRLLEALFSLI